MAEQPPILRPVLVSAVIRQLGVRAERQVVVQSAPEGGGLTLVKRAFPCCLGSLSPAQKVNSAVDFETSGIEYPGH